VVSRAASLVVGLSEIGQASRGTGRRGRAMGKGMGVGLAATAMIQTLKRILLP
jgi:hypothetical protein